MHAAPQPPSEILVPNSADYERNFGLYKVIRDEISHEDNLMASRVSWFMASQSFLLTALAIAQGGNRELPNPHNNYFFPLLPYIAIVSDLLILAGALAGIHALQRWRHLLRETSPHLQSFPQLRRRNFTISLGWSSPVGLPLVFLAAWVYLLWKGYHVRVPIS